MAFSLLDHIQTNYQAELNQLLSTQSSDSQQSVIALALGELIVLDKKDSMQLYQAIRQQEIQFFAQTINDHEVAQLGNILQIEPSQLNNALTRIFQILIQEIKQLDDAANFEQAGISELIQAQQDYLAGQAPDQVWQLIGLNQLEGQAVYEEDQVDLAQSMASLTKIMHEASQYQQQVSGLDSGDYPASTDVDNTVETNDTPKKNVLFIIVIIVLIVVMLGSALFYGN